MTMKVSLTDISKRSTDAAGVARDRPIDQREDAADDGDGDAEQQRVADGDGELPEHVLAARGGAERVVPARAARRAATT